MTLVQPLNRRAVLKAVREFDRLGQKRFLIQYGFRKSTTYFLLEGGKAYDAKAIVGAAHKFLPPQYKALTWADFGSREVTTKQWLEDLNFKVVGRHIAQKVVGTYASTHLDIGNLYSRAQLKRTFSSDDATIMTGVFRPAGFRSVCLFVTEEKTADRTPFKDALRGNTLRWQGQLSGRTDYLISEHVERNLELLLFYRRSRYEYPDAAFR